MKKIKFLQLLFILSAFIVSPLLRADDFFIVKDKIIEESRFKLGFLYFTPLYYLENVGYSNSIYNYENSGVPDWTADVGLGLRASAITANRLILQVEDLPYYSFYLDTKSQRSWSNRFRTSAYSYIGPFNFKLGFEQSSLRQRPNLEFGRPFHYEDREWSGEVDIGRRWSLFATAYASSKVLDYGTEPYLDGINLAENLNHHQNSYGIKLNRKVFTGTLIYANYEYDDYVFEFSPKRNSGAQKLALGVEFPEIGVLQGGFEFGLKSFQPSNPLYLHPQRLTGRGDIQIALMDRLRFNLFYQLQTYFSYNSIDLFYDEHSFGGGVEIYLLRFLKVGASAQDGRLKYFSFLDLELKRSDRIRQQRFYLAFPFLADTSIGFAYNINRLTSDVLNFDRTYKFWGGFISYEF